MIESHPTKSKGRKQKVMYVRCPRCGKQGWLISSKNRTGFFVSHYENKVMNHCYIGKNVMVQILNQFEGIIE